MKNSIILSFRFSSLIGRILSSYLTTNSISPRQIVIITPAIIITKFVDFSSLISSLKNNGMTETTVNASRIFHYKFKDQSVVDYK